MILLLNMLIKYIINLIALYYNKLVNTKSYNRKLGKWLCKSKHHMCCSMQYCSSPTSQTYMVRLFYFLHLSCLFDIRNYFYILIFISAVASEASKSYIFMCKLRLSMYLALAGKL